MSWWPRRSEVMYAIMRGPCGRRGAGRPGAAEDPVRRSAARRCVRATGGLSRRERFGSHGVVVLIRWLTADGGRRPRSASRAAPYEDRARPTGPGRPGVFHDNAARRPGCFRGRVQAPRTRRRCFTECRRPGSGPDLRGPGPHTLVIGPDLTVGVSSYRRARRSHTSSPTREASGVRVTTARRVSGSGSVQEPQQGRELGQYQVVGGRVLVAPPPRTPARARRRCPRAGGSTPPGRGVRARPRARGRGSPRAWPTTPRSSGSVPTAGSPARVPTARRPRTAPG